jgi:hypothetical protein
MRSLAAARRNIMKVLGQWRISLAMIAVLASMMGLVAALHGIVMGEEVVFYAGSGALCGGLAAATMLLERVRNRRG